MALMAFDITGMPAITVKVLSLPWSRVVASQVRVAYSPVCDWPVEG